AAQRAVCTALERGAAARSRQARCRTRDVPVDLTLAVRSLELLAQFTSSTGRTLEWTLLWRIYCFVEERMQSVNGQVPRARRSAGGSTTIPSRVTRSEVERR